MIKPKVFKFVGICLGVLIIFSYSFLLINFNQSDLNNGGKTNFIENLSEVNLKDDPLTSTNNPNGKPLLIHQYANISNSQIFNDVSSGENISFNLAGGWTSKNVTINYEGVSKLKDYVLNGDLATTMDNWTYDESDSGGLIDSEYRSDRGNPMGGYRFTLNAGDYLNGDYCIIYQNIVIPESLASKTAIVSCDVVQRGNTNYPPNASYYISVIANGVEKNHTIDMEEYAHDTWSELSMQYDPVLFGQSLPGSVTLKVGVIIDEDCTKIGTPTQVLLDNIKFELWTLPNEEEILKALDTEYSQNYTYINTTYGEGYSFIDIERYRSSSENIIFTIYENITESLLDFQIDSITIYSPGIKDINTTYLGTEGSFYTLGTNIEWQTDFPITIPYAYDSWVEIEKPLDWLFISIIDGFEFNQTNNCLGREYGSTILTIPNTALGVGQWKLNAISKNYMENGNIAVWDINKFIQTSKLTFADYFYINVSLNNSLTLANTRINCTIYYPNASIFWQGSKEPTSYIEKFGNFTVGTNMSIGTYHVKILWTNNNSYLSREKIGYIDLNFILWHNTSLTPVTSYFERLAGDPLVIYVNYTDIDLGTYLGTSFQSETVATYNSTFGASGTMMYSGFGVYSADIDTSGLALGIYYFSFNISKPYYVNRTEVNIIQLNIIAQPLKLEVPKTTIYAIGNSYAVCQINVTGAFSDSPIWPVNVSTNWQKPYTVTDHLNGTQTLNFSTQDLPISGLLENFVISIFANKTNYGDTSEQITISINPIPTNGNLNETLINAYKNENFDIKANFTEEGLGTLISGANCTITWDGLSTITPISDEFIINLDTYGLNIDVHNALIKLEKPGYETIYLSVTVVVQLQDVNLTVSLNSIEIVEDTLVNLYFKEIINVSVRVFALGEQIYLSGGTLKWISDYYVENLTESPSTYYNTSITIDAANFSAGINYIYLHFQQANFTTKLFSLQIFVKEQDVNLSVSIDSIEISENAQIERYFKESINISVRAYAEIEKIFLSGSTITWISNNYQKNLTEYPITFYNYSVQLDGANFSSGLNYIVIQFQQANYTTTAFSFLLFLRAQTVNITLKIDGQDIIENELVERYFNQVFNISCRAYANSEKVYLTGGNFTFVNNGNESVIAEYGNFWFNKTFTISTTDFDLGINYVYVKFVQDNYTTTIFSFQLQVQQIGIEISPQNFQGILEGYVGETVKIEIRLVEQGSPTIITGAIVRYSWDYGVGTFTEKGNGIYEVTVDLPPNIEGSFQINLIISKTGGIFQTTEYTVNLNISQREAPPYLLWFILAALLAGIGILSALSIRAYVLIPRARKKESKLLLQTQRFKDMRNIQAIMVIHRDMSIPFYSETFTFLTGTDPQLFSGFIQALTMTGREIASKESETLKKKISKMSEEMMEFDFKYFQMLLYDYEQLRFVFILKEASSERLKNLVKELAINIQEKLGESIKNFTGIIDPIRDQIGPIISEVLDLTYKKNFKIPKDPKIISKILSSGELSKMEKRIMNVLISHFKHQDSILLEEITGLVSEKNENLIIEAIESLLQRQFLVQA